MIPEKEPPQSEDEKSTRRADGSLPVICPAELFVGKNEEHCFEFEQKLKSPKLTKLYCESSEFLHFSAG
jgi:hypothetical protein